MARCPCGKPNGFPTWVIPQNNTAYINKLERDSGTTKFDYAKLSDKKADRKYLASMLRLPETAIVTSLKFFNSI